MTAPIRAPRAVYEAPRIPADFPKALTDGERNRRSIVSQSADRHSNASWRAEYYFASFKRNTVLAAQGYVGVGPGTKTADFARGAEHDFARSIHHMQQHFATFYTYRQPGDPEPTSWEAP